jgi:hypothetical protein
MIEASRLATSTTKTDRKAFVTLRFAGEELDPRAISAILPVEPTRAHRKGEAFASGEHAGTLRGRTGVWFLATDRLVGSDCLDDHLRFVRDLVYPVRNDDHRASALRTILGETHSRARVTCFWYGDPGEAAPEIPEWFRSAVMPLNAELETDFATADPLHPTP